MKTLYKKGGKTMIYTIKFHSMMTDNNFYVCGDLETLENNEYDIKTAFFNMVYSDEYNERDTFADYFSLLDDLELTEINDLYEVVNETDLYIIKEYNSRF